MPPQLPVESSLLLSQPRPLANLSSPTRQFHQLQNRPAQVFASTSLHSFLQCLPAVSRTAYSYGQFIKLIKVNKPHAMPPQNSPTYRLNDAVKYYIQQSHYILTKFQTINKLSTLRNKSRHISNANLFSPMTSSC